MNLPPIHLNDESLQIINNIYNTLKTHSSYSGCDFEFKNDNPTSGIISIETYKNSYLFYSYSFYSKTIRDGNIANMIISGEYLEALLEEINSSMEIFGLPVESAEIGRASNGFIDIHLQPYELSTNWLTKKMKINKKEKDRDFYCYSAFYFSTMNIPKCIEWYKLGLSKPDIEESIWKDKKVLFNLGVALSNVGNYEDAYGYLTKAYNGGVQNPNIIKEINWLDGFLKAKGGEKNEFTGFTFHSSYQERFTGEKEACPEHIQSIINISLSSDKKRIKLGLVSILQTKQATLTIFNPESSNVHTYISDGSDFAFHITYSDENKIDKIGIEMLGDRNLLVEYYE